MNLLTVKAVASLLNVSPACVYLLAEQGRLTGFRIGVGRGTWRFDEEDVRTYLQSSISLRSAQPKTTRRSPSQPFKHLDGQRLRAAWRRQGVLPAPRAGQPEGDDG